MPFDTAKIRAIPIIPMLPANAVSVVLPFLVNRFFKESPKEVHMDIEGFFLPASFWLSLEISVSFSYSSFVSGMESSKILPSSIFTIRVEYFAASSGLWVTMITSRSEAISFRISITWILVSVSNAPVGSSARIISGSFTMALAMATLCICPPDISLGFL